MQHLSDRLPGGPSAQIALPAYPQLHFGDVLSGTGTIQAQQKYGKILLSLNNPSITYDN